MKLEQVLHLAGIQKSAWYDAIKDGKAPAPDKHPLAPGAKVYIRTEIMALLAGWEAQIKAERKSAAGGGAA